MWSCPQCNRNFKHTNQSHICVQQDMGALFVDKPDELVLAFDTLCTYVMSWKPNSVGASKHSIVFTSEKAWLIVKPMKQELDLKFYHGEILSSAHIRRVSQMGKKYAHHLRIRNEFQLTREVLELLREGYLFSLEG